MYIYIYICTYFYTHIFGDPAFETGALGVRSAFLHSRWFYAAFGCVRECAFENARLLLRSTCHVQRLN